jgi:thiol-disulfide isomerase/thioredoxin
MYRFCIIVLSFFYHDLAECQSIASWKITDVVNFYSKPTDSIYVVNFWSTWCKPCIEEIPYLQSITKKYADKKVKLLLVSLDTYKSYPEKLNAFIKKHKIYSAIAWLNETDADIFCPAIDNKWSGAIPATIIVNSKTGYKNFFEEKFSPKQFELELKKAFAGNKQ